MYFCIVGWKHRENFKLYYQGVFPVWAMEQQFRHMQNQGAVVDQQMNYAGMDAAYSQVSAGMYNNSSVGYFNNSSLSLGQPHPTEVSMQMHPPMFRAPPPMAPPTTGAALPVTASSTFS
jgi:hypothetical protein